MKYLSTLLLFLLITGLMSTMATSQVTPDDNHDSETSEDDDTNTEETETESEDNETDEDEESDDQEAEIESAYEREVEVEEGDREWKIESEMKNGENKDKFEAEFKIGGGDEPEIELKYATESSSNETEMKYRVNFDELIEYSNTGDLIFDEDNDTVVSIYELDKADWEAIVYSTESIDGNSVHTATATTSDGIFTLILKLSTGITNLDNTVVTPNAIKIDIIIDGYNYAGNGTYLTLQTDIKTEHETEIEQESEDEEQGFAEQEAQVSVDSTEARAFFSWVEFAEADGTTVDVISSSLKQSDEADDDVEENETHQIIFFTFDVQNPEKIVWDPKVGVVSESVQQLINSIQNSNGLAVPFPFWIVLITLALPLWSRRRH